MNSVKIPSYSHVGFEITRGKFFCVQDVAPVSAAKGQKLVLLLIDVIQ